MSRIRATIVSALAAAAAIAPLSALPSALATTTTQMINSTSSACAGAPSCYVGGCKNPAQLREDPYEADVHDNPGVMVWVCDEHLKDMADDI